MTDATITEHAGLTLVIGNRNYSSWSLRPWLALDAAGAAFETVMIPLRTPTTRAQLLRYSPSGKAPVLIDRDCVIWDSLAICEYIAERWPNAGLWPDDRDARAHARSISAEMHAGFMALRERMPMNIKALHPGAGMSDGVAADIERIDAIWRDCRTRHAERGPFLFGRFSIADCMYAPVIFRFATYRPSLSERSAAYLESMLDHPAMRQWRDASANESETIPDHDTRYA